MSEKTSPEEMLQSAKFLIVDDELSNIRVLEKMLEQWHCTNVASSTDPREAVPLYNSFQPDIILLDLMMPEMDGFQVMEQLKPLIPESASLPIVVLTADTTNQTKRKALAAGARDFLTKPFDHTELLLRLCNLLKTRFLHLQLQNQNVILEEKVAERTRELKQSEIETLECLALAAEFRDDQTGQHTQRVGLRAGLIARQLGLKEEQVELIRRAAPLHDVGKIGIPDSILLKPGGLNKWEFEEIKLIPRPGIASSRGITHHSCNWRPASHSLITSAGTAPAIRKVSLARPFPLQVASWRLLMPSMR